jgi:hypothetical protein
MTSQRKQPGRNLAWAITQHGGDVWCSLCHLTELIFQRFQGSQLPISWACPTPHSPWLLTPKGQTSPASKFLKKRCDFQVTLCHTQKKCKANSSRKTMCSDTSRGTPALFRGGLSYHISVDISFRLDSQSVLQLRAGKACIHAGEPGSVTAQLIGRSQLRDFLGEKAQLDMCQKSVLREAFPKAKTHKRAM